MIYGWGFAARAKCPKEQRQEVVERISFMEKLADKARLEGILALEADLPGFDSFILREGMEMVLDGVDSETVRRTLGTYILMGNFRGKELLLSCVEMEGVYGIQTGENPRVICRRLMAFLGTKYVEKVRKNERLVCKKLSDYREETRNKAPRSKKTALLEGLIDNLGCLSGKILLNEISAGELVKALAGASGKVQSMFLDFFSLKTAGEMIEDWRKEQYSEEEIIEAQKKILDVIEDLDTKGELCLKDRQCLKEKDNG